MTTSMDITTKSTAAAVPVLPQERTASNQPNAETPIKTNKRMITKMNILKATITVGTIATLLGSGVPAQAQLRVSSPLEVPNPIAINPRPVFLLPDLIVEGCEPYHLGVLAVAVRNRGTAPARPSTVLIQSNTHPAIVFPTPALNPGQAVVLLVPISTAVLLGPIYLYADFTNGVWESNETNNFLLTDIPLSIWL